MVRRAINYSKWALISAGFGLVAFGLAISSSAAGIRGDSASSPRLTIPNPSGSHIQLNFGTDRSKRKASLVVISTPPASALNVYVVGDLMRQDGAAQLPAYRVKVDKEPTTGAGTDPNEASVTVIVTVDPRDAPPGIYEGGVRIAAVGGEALVLPLTVTLKGGNALGVFLIIALGSIVGIGTKWLSDAGATLNQANERYLRLITQLGGQLWPNVPLPSRSQLDQARLAISQLDPAAANAALDQLEKNVPIILRQANLLSDVASELSAQSNLVLSAGVVQAPAVLAREQSLFAQRLRDTLPDDATAAAKFETDLSQFAGFTTLLRTYPNATVVQRTNLDKAATLYQGNDFAGGLKEVQSSFAPQASTAVPAGTAVTPQPGAGAAPTVGQPGFRARLGAFMVRWQPWLSALVIALLTALIGVQVLYYANPTFGANGIDNLVAFGWGFGLQLAGTTLAQIGGSLAGRGPKLG
jgi:hypothetical protein